MKKIIIILLIGMGICLWRLDMVFSSDGESEINLVFLEKLNAIKTKDYDRLWDYQPEYEKLAHFKNDKENIKTWIDSIPADKLNFANEEKIVKITFITPSRVDLEVTPPTDFGDYYLVKEDGKWRFDILSERYKYVRGRLLYIGGQIVNFYDKEQRWPVDINEVIKFSPQIENCITDVFDDENKPFRYIVTGEGWKLYSLGPDSKDDNGEVIYNKENGLFSAGDIVVTQKDINNQIN